VKLAIINVLIIVLIALVQTVVRLENYHYANVVGFCSEYNIKDPKQRIEREECQHTKQIRNIWMQHLYAAFTNRW